MTAKILTVVCLFAAFYIGGIGHGIALGWTWEKRMRRWADSVVSSNEKENEPCG